LIVFADGFTAISRALYVRQSSEMICFITTDPIVICVPLILLSICVFGVTCEKLLPAFAGEYQDKWLEYNKLQASKHILTTYRKASAIATYVFISILVIVLLLFVDSYVKVTRTGIEINRFLDLGGKSYRWSEVSDVNYGYEDYVCKDCNQTHKRLSAKVVFKDGNIWKPDTSFGRREASIEKAVRYVAEQKKLLGTR